MSCVFFYRYKSVELSDQLVDLVNLLYQENLVILVILMIIVILVILVLLVIMVILVILAILVIRGHWEFHNHFCESR